MTKLHKFKLNFSIFEFVKIRNNDQEFFQL